METANILLAIGGDRGNTVPKYSVTAAEVAVMRFIHGDDAVFDIEIVGDVQRTHRQEIARLSEQYGRQEGERRVSPAVQQLYPGAAARVFETFEELEIPDELYIAAGRKTKRAASASKADKGVDGSDDAALDKMNVNALRALADKIGVDLAGISKKADIIEAIELAQSGQGGDDEDDDGVGDMNDEFSEKNDVLG